MSTLNETLGSTLGSAADASVLLQSEINSGFASRILSGLNAWTVVIAILAGLVLYDQGM